MQSDDTPPASPAATDEDVAKMVEKLQSSDCPFCGHDPYHYVDIGVGMERVAVTCCDYGVALFQYGDEQLIRIAGERREAADLLARVARERDEWHHAAMVENDTNASTLRKLKAAERRAEAAENALAIANQGGLDLLYAIRKAIGWTDKHALSLLPDECARLKKAAVRNAPIWPGKDFDHSQPGGFDSPTGAD